MVLPKECDGWWWWVVRKFKDIIFESCVRLWCVIFEPVYFLGYEFDVMAVTFVLFTKKKEKHCTYFLGYHVYMYQIGLKSVSF